MKDFASLIRLLRDNKIWPEISKKKISQLISHELGDPHALTKGYSLQGIQFRARAPKIALVICAGNLPVAVWQILTRLAILEVNTVFLKLPSSPYRKAIQTIAQAFQKKKLFRQIGVVSTVTDSLIQKADTTIVYGNDETISNLRARVPWKKRFLGYGHKISCGIIFPEDFNSSTAKKVALDFLTYQQEGCLSPHLFYLLGNPDKFISQIAQQIKFFSQKMNLTALSSSQKALVYSLRQESLLIGCQILTPTQDLNTTLIFDPNPTFIVSSLNRVLYLKPAKNLNHVSQLLQPYQAILSTVSMSQVKPFSCGATRFCPLGRMQHPSFFWKQDGYGTLNELVTWETIE